MDFLNVWPIFNKKNLSNQIIFERKPYLVIESNCHMNALYLINKNKRICFETSNNINSSYHTYLHS